MRARLTRELNLTYWLANHEVNLRVEQPALSVSMLPVVQLLKQLVTV